MTNNEKQTRLDMFEIANLADITAAEFLAAGVDWFEVLTQVRKASRRLFAADVRHANNGSSTAAAEQYARMACIALATILEARRLSVDIRGDMRYIEITNMDTGARYALV